MKRRDFLRDALVLGSGGVSAFALPAQAQNEARELRLVFSRNGELYVSPGMDGSDARRVLTIGANALWAVSPDGRRVVWMPQSDIAKTNPTVFLSDLIGRHQKKLLTLADLRDRQGNAIKKAGVDGAETLSEWQTVSLGWSADGRTVYVGFSSGDAAKRATFAVDSVNGTALIDGDGRWKLIAPLTNIDAQGGLLVGIDTGADGTQNGGPIAIVNTTEGGIRTVLSSGKSGGAFKSYDVAQNIALAPDNRSLAYVGAEGNALWLRDRWATGNIVPLKLAERATGSPQWAENSKAVLFLLPTTDANNLPSDLYQVDIPTAGATVAAPRLVLKNVDAFALAPL